jgi:hypothetical protein
MPHAVNRQYCRLLGTPKRSGMKAVCVSGPLRRSDLAVAAGSEGVTANATARPPAIAESEAISTLLRFIEVLLVTVDNNDEG